MWFISTMCMYRLLKKERTYVPVKTKFILLLLLFDTLLFAYSRKHLKRRQYHLNEVKMTVTKAKGVFGTWKRFFLEFLMSYAKEKQCSYTFLLSSHIRGEKCMSLTWLAWWQGYSSAVWRTHEYTCEMLLFSIPSTIIMNTRLTYREIVYIPKRNSPKFPQPIFLPTLKFGPTINTPVLPEVCLLEPCIPRPLALEILLFGSSCVLLSTFCTPLIIKSFGFHENRSCGKEYLDGMLEKWKMVDPRVATFSKRPHFSVNF